MARLLVSGDADLLAIRFARSAAWETHEAVRSLVGGRPTLYHRPWHHAVADAAAGIDLAPLLAVSPLRTGWVPDFLTPPPAGPAPTFQEQLGEIRETPLAQVAIELERCRGNDRDHEYLPVLEGLIADPRAARDLLADCLEVAWHMLVAPFWPRISALIEADVEYRSRRLAAGGLGRMLEDLHPAIGWADGAIRVDAPPDADVELGGRGLVLMPSAYLWPSVAVVVDEPWQPTLVYPARGVGELWGAPDAAPHVPLARLLGRTRALLLTCLDTPTSTTALAGRLGRSASGVSGHLVALRDAGLVKSARHGHEVRYSQTELGADLVRGSVQP